MQVVYGSLIDMKQLKRRSDCPISFALDIFGDKWTLLIIRDLMFKGKINYGDFLDSDEKIATNILADRLQMLEKVGILEKSRDSNIKTKYIYTLTKKGIDLLPVLVEIVLWSAKYDPKTAADKNFVARALKDKRGLIKDIRENLEKKK